MSAVSFPAHDQPRNRLRVLMIFADNEDGADDVQQQLESTGRFREVGRYNGLKSTPSASELAGYDAVLVFSWHWFKWADPDALGDSLAAYWEGGGGVVTCSYTNARGGHAIGGAWGDAALGYLLMDKRGEGERKGADSIGRVAELDSPLMAGVSQGSRSGP